MSELSQAERIAALRAKRADRLEQIEPLTFAEAVAATDAPPPNPVGRERRITISKPTPQRVVATGVSVASFAAMTVAMGPLTAQTADTDEGDDAQVVASVDDQTIAQVPAPPPEVVVEVVPNYVAVSEDGTPIVDVNVLSDGTLAAQADGADLGSSIAPPDDTTQQVLASNAAPATTVAAVDPAVTAAPATAAPTASDPAVTAAPATAAPTASAPAATAAPTTAAPTTSAPAATAAPATTAAPRTTQAPATTAAPTTTAAPAATNPPPPPKSEASG